MLAGAVLRRADLTGNIFTAVDFSGANFRETNFNDVYFGYSNLSGADLRGADLTDCKVGNVSLRGANLANADLSNLRLGKTDFTQSNLTNADFSGANIKSTDFSGANIDDVHQVDSSQLTSDEVADRSTETSDTPGKSSQPKADNDDHVRLLHTTNTFLDRSNMGRKVRRQDYLSAFEQIVDYACSNDVDALLHTGNFFWTKQPDDAVVRKSRELLSDLNESGVEFVFVLGERDINRTSSLIDKFKSQDLIATPSTGWHKVSQVGLFLYSVNSPKPSEIEPSPPQDVSAHLAALYSDIDTATHGDGLSKLERQLNTSFDVVLIGDRIETVRTEESGTRVLSPGMPERIIGKQNIESQPRTPVFFQYDVTSESFTTTSHEVDARPVCGCRINLSSDATKKDVRSTLPREDIQDAAVMASITGTRGDDSLTKKTIQDTISRRAGIAKVYDYRDEVEETNTESVSQGQSTATEWNIELLASATTLGVQDIERSIGNLTEGGCPEDEAFDYVQWYLKDMLVGEGLFAVRGIGPKNGSELVRANVTTINELLSRSPEKLAKEVDLTLERIRQMQESARAGEYSSLDPDDERAADILINSSLSLPNSETTTLSKTQRGTTDSESSTTSQSNSQSESGSADSTDESTATTDSSRQTPLKPTELPVLKTGERTAPSGSTVFPNYLSEYYESFRSTRNVVESVFQIPGTDIDPSDPSDPRVQYYVLLDACIGFGDDSIRFAGYGPQHQNRISFSVPDYRSVYGDGERVQDYQVINVKPFNEETLKLLYEKTDVSRSVEFIRPCLPGTSYPLPELPGTFEELQDAMAQLATFPAYPPLPTENGVDERTLPIAEIYQACFKELNEGSKVNLTPLNRSDDSPPTGPITAATPTSTAEAESLLLDYGRLSHLFRRITPPSNSPANRTLNVFGLDWYRPNSPNFEALQTLAKHDDNAPVDAFLPRLRDMIHRRFLLDTWEYDYITVFPSHEEGTLSQSLVELAQDAVLETDIIYTPLLERTQTIERQQEKSKREREKTAAEPSKSIRARAQLDGDTVILLDDICTTGSSLTAGAHLLRQAGVDRVICLTLGFTPGGPLESVTEITDPHATASEIISGIKR
jgi:DNA repair exonuclease SbcCD nuclease subunit